MSDRVPLGDDIALLVSLAIRAHRRALGLSQRGYAEHRGLPKSHVARLESDAGAIRLADVLQALAATGYHLRLVDDACGTEPRWISTELAARDRIGRRFPAHRTVQASPTGPRWWWHNEALAPGGCGPAPRWSAENWMLNDPHLPAPRSRPTKGGVRWPFVTCDAPSPTQAKPRATDAPATEGCAAVEPAVEESATAGAAEPPNPESVRGAPRRDPVVDLRRRRAGHEQNGQRGR